MFVHDDSIELPTLRQKNLDSGRVYEVVHGADTGVVYPSITRILGAQPKPGLDAWKKRVGYAKAAAIAGAAAKRGTSLHALAEDYLCNISLPSYTPSVAELWQHLRPWLDKHITKVYRQEADVYSNKLMVAGRFDLLAEVDGTDLAVVDFKQANKPKKEEHVAESYYLQGSFYSMAVFELTGRKAKRIIFPVCSPEGLQVFETTPLQHLPRLMQAIDHFYKSIA